MSINENQKLIASDGKSEDNFGESVCISGEYVVIGAPRGEKISSIGKIDSGSAYIFRKDEDGNFTKVQELTASDGVTGDNFGTSVAMNGDYVIIGAPGDDYNFNKKDSGSAYIFKRDHHGNFTQIQKLVASDGEAGDYFGNSVSITDKYIAVGAPSDTRNIDRHGSVYLFKRNSNDNFAQVAKFLASDEPNVGLGNFGYSVSMSGKYIAVGSPNYGDWNGKVYLFRCNSDMSITEIAAFTGESGQDSYFANSVSISGEYVAVGAPGEPSEQSCGRVYLYKIDSSNSDVVTRIGKLSLYDGTDPYHDYNFGRSVAISGDHVIACAPNEDTGTAYIYKNDGNDNFLQTAKLTPSDGSIGDLFGKSVAIDSEHAVIGAPRDDNGGNVNSGSAYLYCLHESILQIASYQIQYFSGAAGNVFRAIIALYNSQYEKFADIKFYKSEADVPADDTKSPSGFIECHCPSEQYPEVLDLLRNEKPVFLHFNNIDKTGHLATNLEPVGEGE